MRYANRRVVVTGASRGIGHAIATEFRNEGAWVIGTRTTDSNAVGADPCQEWIRADFSSRSDIETCATKLGDSDIDILVNNAGINRIAPFADVAADEFLEIQQVNVFAPFRLCQSVIPGMRERGWGRIINISSIWGKLSKAHRASYSASKFALDGLTLALAAEHSADGIMANCIAPGFIDTELTRRVLGESEIDRLTASVPARRLGTTAEIARLVLFLASEENTYLTGQNIAIDGGFTRV